jgi:hypothetical protein
MTPDWSVYSPLLQRQLLSAVCLSCFCFCLVSVSVYACTSPKVLAITDTGLGVLAEESGARRTSRFYLIRQTVFQIHLYTYVLRVCTVCYAEGRVIPFGENQQHTRIQGLNSSSVCIPPPWLATKETIHVTTFECTPRREKTSLTRYWETSFRSLFTSRTSYLLGLSGPQSLYSYRLETESRLGTNQTLSLSSCYLIVNFNTNRKLPQTQCSSINHPVVLLSSMWSYFQ